MKKHTLLLIAIIGIAFMAGYYISNRVSSNIDIVQSLSSSNTNVQSFAIIPPTKTEKHTATPKPSEEAKQYVLNKNTKKFHKPSCSSVNQMKNKNKLVVTKARQEIIDDGYDPCGRCHP